MPIITRRFPHLIQPQYPVRVNRDLLPGLEFLYLPPIRKDLVGGIDPAISGTVARVPGSAGIADDFDGSAYLTFGSNNDSASFTSVFVAYAGSLASALTISESSFGSSSDSSQQIRITTTGGVELIRDNVAAVISGGSSHVTAGRVFCAVVSWDNTTGAGYIAVDGQIVQTASPGTQTWATAGDFVLGRKRSSDSSESAAHRTYLYGRSSQYVAQAIGQKISANPWRIFEDRKQNIYVSAASGGTTVSVPAGALTLTGYAPTVATSDHKTVSVPAGSLTLTGFAPTVSASSGTTIAVPAGSLTLTGYAPVIVNPHTISIPLATLSLTGYAPTVLAGVTVSVPLGSLSLTGFAPTVINPVSISIPAGGLTLTGFAPTVSNGAGITVSVPNATLALTGFAPAVAIESMWRTVSASGGVWVDASAASGTWTEV